MLLLYCTEHSSVGWWADYVTSRSLLSLILMITCLTSLAGLTFCTLFNSLYSYFLSYDSFWTKDPALQAACRPSCLSSVHMCVSQMPTSGEALTKQGLRHLCRHYSSSTTLYEPLWPQFCPNFYLLAICACIHELCFAHILLNFGCTGKRLFFLLDNFFKWCFSFTKRQHKNKH